MNRSPLLLALLAVPLLASRPALADSGAAGFPLVRPVAFQGFRSLLLPMPAAAPRPPSAPPALPAVVTPSGPAPSAQPGTGPGAMCRAAIARAAARYGVPVTLMQAVALVETGRADPATGQRTPWPWSVNIEGEGRVFDTEAQAIAWVQQAQAVGHASIDTGCMQVNLKHHPDAFASLAQAFDPDANADYAARFLRTLRDGAGGDWMAAAGLYHSQTPSLAAAYRRQVQAAMDGSDLRLASAADLPAAVPLPAFGSMTPAALPSAIITPKIITPSPGSGMTHVAMLPAPSGTVGRDLAGYRAMPIRLNVAPRLPPRFMVPQGRS